MSKQVDERVVTMQFDNKQFEDNVKTSMSTIDKLKKALNFEKAGEGLEKVKDSINLNKINITGLSGAIEQDADLVLMLSRPALSGRDTDRKSTYPTEGLGVIDIVKHRNGTTKELYFRHDPSMTKLEDYVPGIAWMKKNTTA